MDDSAPSDLDKRITRLLSIGNSLNQKLDALTFAVSDLSRRLEALEERLVSGNIAESDSERLTQIEEEIEVAEQERASHRNPANMISLDELTSLLK